ncbi:MAG: flagellar M-ring protein FliF C-terminal domain-containing protein, partial [Pseudomonadota bacterium]
KEGKKVQTFAPRSEAELARFEELVQSAIGYDKQRGDTVVVRSVPFHRLVEEAETDWWSVITDWLGKIGRPALNIILIVLFFLFVARPIISWLIRETEPAPPKEFIALPEPKKLDEALPPPRLEKGRLAREQVLILAQQQPERTINLIRSWIDQR